MPHSILSANQENKLFILELHDIQSVGKSALSPHILIPTNLVFEKIFSKRNTLLENKVFMSNKQATFLFFSGETNHPKFFAFPDYGSV